MTRRFVLVSLLVFGLFFAYLNSSADEGDITIGGSFGEVGFVDSRMSGYGTNGFGFGGFLIYAPSDLFDLDINFIYSPHKKSGNKVNSFYGTMALRSSLSFDQLLPFLTAGVGFYRNSLELPSVSDSAASFGFNFGGGLDVDIGRMIRIGLLVRYHPVFAKNISSGARGVNDLWDALFRIGIVFKTGVQGGWD